MKILALNAGSSSIKYKLFDGSNDYELLRQGVAERIGQENSSISQSVDNVPTKTEISLPDHRLAMQALFPEGDAILEDVDAVGHRVVHGGERYRNPTVLSEEVIQDLAQLAKFAPLHCAPNIIGIEELQRMLPHVPHVAVFDTAAHAGMSFKSFLYGIPLEYYEKYKVRKYGFHGINHSYVAHEAARILKKKLNQLKVITCHLGNGCSITAFENGVSVENSMGLTPLEGLVMGTRCGDIDPSIVLYLIDELGLTVKQVTELLNKKSGLVGLCGKSDMRDIIERAKSGDKLSQMAMEIFVYRVQKYIGAYVAALNGVDAIVFTGGIGENSSYIRSRVAKNFSYLRGLVDEGANEKNKTIFSAEDSAILLMCIPAQEEIEIAKQISQMLTQGSYS